MVDPHPLWLEGVEPVMRRSGVQVVGRATDFDDARALVQEHGPDLVVTEVVAGGDASRGLAFVRDARGHARDPKVIVLSTSGDHVEAALDAGAAAYVVKTADRDDIAWAINQAFRLSIFFAAERRDVGRSRSGPEAVARSRLAEAGLTRRELEILRLVAEGRSNRHVARTLWVTEQTVKFHLSNIYRKLDVSNRTEASRCAQLGGALEGAQALAAT